MLFNSTKKLGKHKSVSLYANATSSRNEYVSGFSSWMLDARPYKPFKQDNVKKVTVLTADTPSKIFELKFSGVISVILTSRHEEYDFSPTRDSNIRNMALLQTTQKKKKKKKDETDNRENEIPTVHYLVLLLRTHIKFNTSYHETHLWIKY